MLRFQTDIAGCSWNGLSFNAVEGVIEIPAESIGPFQSLIDCGVLVPIPDPAPETATRSVKAKK